MEPKGPVTYVSNYLEAAGLVSAMRAGVSIDSVLLRRVE